MRKREVNNIRILLLSHAELCKEMYETMVLIMGKQDSVKYITLPYGANMTEYENKVKKEIIDFEDDVLILVDLFGGSPFMIVSKLLQDKNINCKVEVITGLNLPMLLETVSKINDSSLKELANVAFVAGEHGIVDVKKKLSLVNGG